MTKVWAMRPAATRSLVPLNNDDHRMYITGFGQDAAGELYAMGLARVETGGVSGSVFALVPAGEVTTSLG